MADDPGELLRELAAVDRRGAVWCAALCAQSVLCLVPPSEDRPRKAVELALDYARGIEVPRERRRAVAASAASDSDAAAYAASDAASYAYAADAAYAYAADAADADASAYASAAAAYASDASDAAAYAAAYAASAASANSAYSAYTWERARAEVLARLAALVRGQATPVAPTVEDVRQARPEAQVAWDWMVEHALEPVRVGTLGEALDRARRLGLCWECPVERAVAERARDEEVVRAILTGRAA